MTEPLSFQSGAGSFGAGRRLDLAFPDFNVGFFIDKRQGNEHKIKNIKDSLKAL
ncbi:hypothetical protein [Dactylosporangium sp. CA-139066]|uniref:hypothetical protein n=1 Tax=Dactylosporangium sp. CA-139066 TaxID=3239930 RepID=UPI003D91CA0F